MSATKDKIRELLNKLPDNCTLEDVQYHLYVIDKVQRGIATAKTEGTMPQDDVEARLSKWTTV